jgi:PIN domain nuclease of toxin-antitoxin system
MLLDTHALPWFVLNDPKLTPTARRLIEDPGSDVLVSPASYWEIAIKVSQKKLQLLSPYDDFMQRGIVGNEFEILPIDPKHTAVVAALPFHHKDPFDRLLVAQAIAERIPVASADEALDPYGIQRLW